MKRARTSEVWTHFTVESEQSKIAICNICLQRFSYRTTVSNLKKHIQSKHVGFSPASSQLDNTKNIVIVVEESQKETCLQSESDNVSQTDYQWKEWNPMALEQNNHPVLSKSKEKRPFDKLTEEKLEIAKIQKKIVTEELEQKIIERKLLEKDLEHKDIIHELEKRHLRLKIVLLDKEIKRMLE